MVPAFSHPGLSCGRRYLPSSLVEPQLESKNRRHLLGRRRHIAMDCPPSLHRSSRPGNCITHGEIPILKKKSPSAIAKVPLCISQRIELSPPLSHAPQLHAELCRRRDLRHRYTSL